MNENFYPELQDAANNEAVALVEKFKESLKKAANDTIATLYVDIMPFIESDSWFNFRSQIMDGFKDYSNAKIALSYDFKVIRRKMFEDYKSEIIEDLNQDILEENEDLKIQINRLQNHIDGLKSGY